MNVHHIVGNLGADPEMKGSSENEFAIFRVATTERWKDREGNKKERTDWHNCIASGGLAKVVSRYLQKGDKVALSGAVRHREHDGKWYTQIAVKDLEMLGKANRSQGEDELQEDLKPQDDDLPF